MLHGKHIIKSFDKDLDNINNSLLSMSQLLIEELTLTLNYFENNNLDYIPQEIIEKEKILNELNQTILDASLKIFTLRSPVAWDLRYVFAASHMAKSLEKNGDNIKKAIKDITGLSNKDKDLDQKIIVMIETNINMHNIILNAFLDQDNTLASTIELEDDKIDKAFSELCNLLLQKIQNTPEKLHCFYNYLFLGRRLEHIGDNVSSIRNLIYFIENGKFID